jgi:hypothetical protein
LDRIQTSWPRPWQKMAGHDHGQHTLLDTLLDIVWSPAVRVM